MMQLTRTSFWIRHIIIILLLIPHSYASFSSVIKGRVTEAVTHKAISGSVVSIVGSRIISVADEKGYYHIKNIEPGIYELTGSCMGYKNSSPKRVEISSKDPEITVDIELEPSVIQVSEVVVSGAQNKESNVSARHDEKASVNVINIVSAKTIEALPDLNVANVLQRVSGLSMMKNSSGNNSQLVIRGMAPRFNSTLINGNVVPTTSSSSRAVPMDLFPSILVGRIEVTKALTPDMEGSGIGGLANIVMKNAPDSSLFTVDLATGYNQYNLNNKFLTFNYKVVNIKNPAQTHGEDYITSPSDFPTANLVLKQIQALPDFNGSVSYGNRFFNKKLGLLVSASMQSTYQSTRNNYLGTSLNANTNNLDTISWNKVLLSNHIKRMGIILKLDYWLNDKNRFNFSTDYFSLIEIRARSEKDTTSDINKGRLYIGNFTNLDRSGLENTSLNGFHILSDNLSIDWTAMYSMAGSQSPDYVSVNYNQVIHPSVQPLYLNYSNAVDRIWQWNSQIEKSIYLNVKYKPELFSHPFEFKIGGMIRDKYLMNNENDYSKDFTTTSNYPDPDVIYLFKNNLLTWLNDQQLEGDAAYNSANFKAHEDISAFYGLLNTRIGKLQVLAGARLEITSQSNQHRGLVQGQKVLLSSSQNYSDLLPSLHLKYELNDKQNLRFSVYKAINRPNISETIPYTSKGANGNSSGNPDLKHTVATCYDARFEVYPGREEVLTAGVFYKDLRNAIEEQVNGNNDRTVSNAPKAINYGFELVCIKYYGNFGISANYTFTRSIISQPKNWNDPEANGGLGATITRIENRPLAGQSPNLINIALIYRNIPAKLNIQLTYTMQGKNLVNINSNYGLDGYQLAYNDLGISLEKQLFKTLSFYLKGSNLLNESLMFQTKNGINTRTLLSERSFLLGIKFKL